MTDEELIRAALHGGEKEWERLHEICADRKRAEALARLLEQHADVKNDAAAAWAEVLAEQHPGLKVNFRSADGPRA